MTPRTWWQRWLTDPLEAGVLWLALAIFGLIPPATASNVGGWLARKIGPMLALSDRARKNLAMAMPELPAEEREELVRGTWENHGRVFGEMPHIEKIVASGAVYARPEDFQVILDAKANGGPVIFVGSHLANFELFGAVTSAQGFPLRAVYRAPNNPLVDRLWRRYRRFAELMPKSAEGAKWAVRVLAERGNLALLIDQKFNEGIPVPFFGRDAMTVSAPAHFAARFKAPIVFGWAVREGPARYRIRAEVVEKAEPAERTAAARQAAIVETTTRINEHLERRVRENPADWFWLHRRWGKL
jgi:Kdo2-lipid IVA lauroyltransferase/acyltransferase